MGADLVAESLRLEALLGVPPLIRLDGKRPIDRDWTKGPRRAASTWRRRLEAHEGNVGMLTGDGLVVIDVDLYVPGAEEAIDELHRLGLPRHTVTGITGGGGRHLLYRSAVPIASRPLDGFPGIDVKGEGGMVVVPPSVHPSSGRSYDWEFSWGPGDVEVPAIDDLVALVELLSTGGHHPSGPLDERDEAAVNLLLEHFGGHHPHERNGWVEVTRPGKEARLGGSATVGAVGRGVVRVWSTHWPELPAGVYGLAGLRRLAGVTEPRIKIPRRDGLRWKPMSSVAIAAVEWLWTDRAALGSLVLLAGREGTGKGMLSSWLSARVSTGTLPGAHDGEPRSVLWLSTEDNFATTIRPRLEAAGADLDRVGLLTLPDGDDATEFVSERLEETAEVITEHHVALVVLDPLISFVPLRLDAFKEQHARAALTPLRNLAEATAVTVLGLVHFGKGHRDDALTAVLNSRAFTAAARGVLVVGFEPGEQPPSTRIVVVRKSNVGRLDVPGFAFEVAAASLGRDDHGRMVTAGKLVERGERVVPPSAEQMMRPGDHEPPSAREEAKEFLLGMLGGGEVLAVDVKRQAALEGISEITLKRAKADLGVISRREGFGPQSRVFWVLPPIEAHEVHRDSPCDGESLWEARASMDEDEPSRPWGFCAVDGCGLTPTDDSLYCWRHDEELS